jgi:uncharacterized protein
MARWFTVQNETRKAQVADKVELASSFRSRLKGLLGRSALPEGQGLWIAPCNSVHTFFMRFPIDVLFLDRGQKVVRVLPDLPARRMTRIHMRAVSCLELRAGAATKTGTSAGDQLRFADRPQP